MQNETIESVANSEEKPKYLLRGASFIATAVAALAASSYIWQNRFLPSSGDLPAGQPIAEMSQPRPSLNPLIKVIEKKQVLLSQLPDINRELVRQASQIPPWFASVVKQQVQPSPKRVVDIRIDDENDDSLVVRDRVVVIPKILNAAPITQVSQKLLPKSSAAIDPIKTAQVTIQLMASPRKEGIIRFVNSHKMPEKLKIRLTKRDGLDWYVLTIGEYKQKEQAEAAIKNLPVELTQFNPWIRPLAQLRTKG